MLLGHSMPAVTNVALSGPGTAWLTADGYAALVDGRPARRARLRWLADPAPQIDHAATLEVTFERAFKPRLIALLGLSCEPGVRVEVRAAGGMPLGGNALWQRTTRFANGTVGLWIATSDTVSTNGLEIAVYNNRDGAPWASPTTALDVGEVVAMPAVEIELQPDWTDELVDPSDVSLSRAAHPVASTRHAYRRFEGTFAAAPVAAVRGGGLASGTDWACIRAALLGDARSIVVPRWRTQEGWLDGPELNRTALYGTARLGPYAHLRGDYYSAGIVAQEVPAVP